MRGFRGNRSAQNAFNSRFGKEPEVFSRSGWSSNQTAPASNGPQLKLPDWVKTPETRERERTEARTPQRHETKTERPQFQVHVNPHPVPAVHPVAQSSSKDSRSKAVSRPKAAAKVALVTAPPVKMRAKAKAKPASKTTHARKPAASKTKVITRRRAA